MKIPKLISKIKKYFLIDLKNNEEHYEECLIGNIINKHYYGQNKEIRKGSKHFGPGTKVYIFPEFGGSGHESIRVLGKPRKAKKLINVVIPTRLIENVRIKKVYNKKVIALIENNGYYQLAKEKGMEDRIERFIDLINNKTEKIE